MSTKKKKGKENGAQQPPPAAAAVALSKDASDLDKITHEALGSAGIKKVVVRILEDEYLKDVKVKSAMQYGILNALAGARGELSADECGAGINTYWEKIKTQTIATDPTLEGLINSGDGWIKEMMALFWLNYGTEKESKNIVIGRGGAEGTNLMNTQRSGCPRSINQSWPRSFISAVRELLQLEYKKSDIVLDSMVKSDMVYILFNNPGNSEAAYYRKVKAIAKRLGFKTIEQLFAVSFIAYLNQTIYFQLKQREDNNATAGTSRSGPLPFLCDNSDEKLKPLNISCASSYTHKHLFGKVENGTSRALACLHVNMLHPDYVFKNRHLSLLPEQIEVKDRGLTSLYLRLPEVRASLKSMLHEPSLSPEGRVTLEAMLEYTWDSYVQVSLFVCHLYTNIYTCTCLDIPHFNIQLNALI